MNLRAAEKRKPSKVFDPSPLDATRASRRSKHDNTEHKSTEDQEWTVTDDQFEVEAILDHQKSVNGRRCVGLAQYEFRVRWRGYSAEHDLWLPYDNVERIPLLQEYIALHPNLKKCINKASQIPILEDNEVEDLFEAKLAELWKLHREYKSARQGHADEEECFKITFVRCFAPRFGDKLRWFHHTNQHLQTFRFNTWCPVSCFEHFLRTCIAWAKQDAEEASNDGRPLDNPFYSANLLTDAGIATESRASIVFKLCPTFAPFHVLAYTDEHTVPFRQSADPWFVHGWQETASVEVPAAHLDDLYSVAPSVVTTKSVHVRVARSMVEIKYERAHMSLTVAGAYAEARYSLANASLNELIPQGCTTAEYNSAPAVIRNLALRRAQQLIGLAQEPSEGDSV